VNGSESEDDYTLVKGDSSKPCEFIGMDNEKWLYRCWFSKGTQFEIRPYISEMELTNLGEIKIAQNETESSKKEPETLTLD
jgi:hypothetical protein